MLYGASFSIIYCVWSIFPFFFPFNLWVFFEQLIFFYVDAMFDVIAFFLVLFLEVVPISGGSSICSEVY